MKIKSIINGYFTRMKENCPMRTYLIWWIFRIIMIGFVVHAFLNSATDQRSPVALSMNLACMFIWEICMAMPKHNVFRYVPPVLQTVITVGVFIAVLGGQYFNFYYELRFWDTALHFFSSIIAVYFGYEIACALMKMEQKNASLTMVLIASIAFSLMCTTLWEIFELGCDQLVTTVDGMPQDVQHWCYELAKDTPKGNTLFNPYHMERWALLDTMTDIIFNMAGTLLGFIGLRLYPYRHKGKHRYDFV